LQSSENFEILGKLSASFEICFFFYLHRNGELNIHAMYH